MWALKRKKIIVKIRMESGLRLHPLYVWIILLFHIRKNVKNHTFEKKRNLIQIHIFLKTNPRPASSSTQQSSNLRYLWRIIPEMDYIQSNQDVPSCNCDNLGRTKVHFSRLGCRAVFSYADIHFDLNNCMTASTPSMFGNGHSRISHGQINTGS